MSTDESSLLSVGSARSKWEQMAQESGAAENTSKEKPLPHTVSSPLKLAHVKRNEISGLNGSNTHPAALAFTPPVLTEEKQISSNGFVPPTFVPPDISDTSTPAKTSPIRPVRPKPAVAKKPAHLSAITIAAPIKDTNILEKKSISDCSHSPLINQGHNKFASSPSIKITTEDDTVTAVTDRFESISVTSTATSHNVSISNAPEHDTVELHNVESPHTRSFHEFVPPPFRQLSTVVPEFAAPALSPPVPPPSRPITPVNRINSFIPPPDPATSVGISTLPLRSNSFSLLASPVNVPRSPLPEPTQFAPPPPLPRLVHPHGTVLPAIITSDSSAQPVALVSPVPPPPPPSRKLNSKLSQSSLNKSDPSPSPPDQKAFEVFGIHSLAQPGLPAPALSASATSIPPPVSIPVEYNIATTTPTSALQAAPYQPPPPPQRLDYFSSVSSNPSSSVSNTTNATSRKASSNSRYNDSSGGEDDEYASDEAIVDYVTYPDCSRTNRRAPIFGGPQHEISTKNRPEVTAIHGTNMVISSTSTKIIDTSTGSVVWSFNHSDVKVTALGFKSSLESGLKGAVFWLGTKDGHIWEVDIRQQAILYRRAHAHMAPIVGIYDVESVMWTVSEDGKVCLWGQSIQDTPKAFRMAPNFKAFCVSGDQIWVGKNRQVHVYHPNLSGTETFNITTRPILCLPAEGGQPGGDFTCATTVSKYPDYIYFGHEDGTITVFSRSRGVATESVNISIYRITTMVGVGKYLWVCLKNGLIQVIDTSSKPWVIMKEWKGHHSSIKTISSNESTFFNYDSISHLAVATVGSESGVCLWDGLLKSDWIGMLNKLDFSSSIFSFAFVI